jgi:hypothetical protein
MEHKENASGHLRSNCAIKKFEDVEQNKQGKNMEIQHFSWAKRERSGEEHREQMGKAVSVIFAGL